MRGQGYKRLYRADPRSPMYVELRRIALQTTGVVPAIRTALAGVALPGRVYLSWVHGPFGLGHVSRERPLPLVVIGRPQRRIHDALNALGPTIRRPLEPIVMSRSEWLTRLNKRELVVRRLRAGPKLWILGASGSLSALERQERDARQTLKAAMAGDDLTDEWDDDFDPAEEFPRPA